MKTRNTRYLAGVNAALQGWESNSQQRVFTCYTEVAMKYTALAIQIILLTVGFASNRADAMAAAAMFSVITVIVFVLKNRESVRTYKSGMK